MKPVSITLQVSIENTDEMIEQIRQQLGNMPSVPDNPQPPPVENAPLVVILGDGKTRIARRYGRNTYADVVAILGLDRLDGVRQPPPSTQPIVCTSPHKEKKRYKQYGKYYVDYDLTLDKQKENLEYLAEELRVDLTVEINKRGAD